MQYREAYEKGRSLLAGRIADADLDARLLLENICHTNIQTLLVHPETKITEKEFRDYLRKVNLRRERQPLAYILGEQEFMGLTFCVTPDVLIPNQDTENLVEEAMRQMDDRSRILDLCTGSGCILLSLLHYSNHCVGVGTDLSGPALKVAAQNARNLGLQDSAVFLEGDLFNALKKAGKENEEKDNSNAGIGQIPEKFDLIISNPPYIPTKVIETLEPEVRTAEPKLALDGGKDGLKFYRRIAEKAMDYLVIGGTLMMEIGYDQAESVSGILYSHGYSGIEIFQDYGGKDRIVRAERPLKI